MRVKVVTVSKDRYQATLQMEDMWLVELYNLRPQISNGQKCLHRTDSYSIQFNSILVY